MQHSTTQTTISEPMPPEAPLDPMLLWPARSGTPTTTLVSITQRVAIAWLRRNVGNRPWSRATVRKYAQQMLDGGWMATHQGMSFDSEGFLIDGQQRLLAVEATGVTIQAQVSIGFPRQTFNVVDMPNVRTAAHTISVARPDSKHVNLMASTVRLLHLYDENRYRVSTPENSALSNAELLNKATEYGLDALEESAARAGHTGKVLLPTVAAGFYYLLVHRNQVAPGLVVDGFLTPVATGVPIISAKDPRLILRNKAIREKARTDRGRQESLAMTIQSWNRFVEQRPMTNLHTPKEAPVIRQPSREFVKDYRARYLQ